jgi:hypothetical protein
LPRRRAFLRQRIEHPLHIERIPHHDCIRQQIQTLGLIGLGFLLPATDNALIGKEQKAAQGMQGFAFVELSIDRAPIGLILQVTQDEEGLNEPAILLQHTRQRILSRIGLELGDKQRGGDPAQLQ